MRKATCGTCGGVFVSGPRGPVAAECPECRSVTEKRRASSYRVSEHVGTVRTCEACGGPSPYKGGRPAKWCDSCRARERRAHDVAHTKQVRKSRAVREPQRPFATGCKVCGLAVPIMAGFNATTATVCPECARTAKKSRRRTDKHMRRAAARFTDLTPVDEAIMRMLAVDCPLCGVELASGDGLPNSKHLDHIVPINVGGEHMRANVRVICRTCNLKRPDDGSDLEDAPVWDRQEALF